MIPMTEAQAADILGILQEQHASLPALEDALKKKMGLPSSDIRYIAQKDALIRRRLELFLDGCKNSNGHVNGNGSHSVQRPSMDPRIRALLSEPLPRPPPAPPSVVTPIPTPGVPEPLSVEPPDMPFVEHNGKPQAEELEEEGEAPEETEDEDEEVRKKEKPKQKRGRKPPVNPLARRSVEGDSRPLHMSDIQARIQRGLEKATLTYAHRTGALFTDHAAPYIRAEFEAIKGKG